MRGVDVGQQLQCKMPGLLAAEHRALELGLGTDLLRWLSRFAR